MTPSELVIENPQPVSLASLNQSYNDIKVSESLASTTLTDSFTLKGLGTINELVAEAVLQIESFTTNGKKSSFLGNTTSKALAVIDPKGSWVAKWTKTGSENAKKEEIKEQTINEIVTNLISHIEQKRSEVINFIEATVLLKDKYLCDIAQYTELKQQADIILANAKQNSREQFDAQRLVTQLTLSIEALSTDIASTINPLIASANISITEINTILPTIEHELKYKGSLKIVQQSLQDLNDMVKTVSNLSVTAGDAIRQDVNNTIYQSLAMLGETGLDVDRMKKIQQEEAAHQRKIQEVMLKTEEKIKRNFNDVQQLSLEAATNRQQVQSNLINYYSSNTPLDTKE